MQVSCFIGGVGADLYRERSGARSVDALAGGPAGAANHSSVGKKPSPRFVPIAGDLRLQRLHPRKALFGTEATLEGELEGTAVEIAFKIEQVHLDHQAPSAVKGRADTDVRHRGLCAERPALLIEHPGPAGIDPGCGQRLIRGVEIRRGETEGPAALVPAHHLPPHRKGVPEQNLRIFHLPGLDQLANPRRVDVAPVHRDLGNDRHREPQLRAGLGEQTHRALAVASIVKIVPDVDFARPQSLVEKGSNEGLGGSLRESGVEGLYDHHVHPERIEKLEFLIQGHQHARRAIGLEDRPGMRLEGVDHGFAAELASALENRIHDRPVPAMHAIEISDGDDRIHQPSPQVLRSVDPLQC